MPEHRAARRLFARAPRGRAAQPRDGRHSQEYREAVAQRRAADGGGMYPMGQAGRVSLAVHLADGEPDRSDGIWRV